MPTNNRVYVTNYNTVTCAGYGVDALWDAVFSKKSYIRSKEGFIPDKKVFIGTFDLGKTFNELLIECIATIIKESNINPQDTILMVGSSVGGMQNSENELKSGKHYHEIDPNLHSIVAISNVLKSHFTFKDSFGFSTACTSSANALGFAHETISKGIYKQVLVVGADAISRTTVTGFNSLGVLSPKSSKPFDSSHLGMNVSEGIGALLLQNRKTDESVEFLGVGYSSDAHHMTHPDPQGIGAKTAMMNALMSANLASQQIDYINAHGTGTKANDVTEANAIASMFSSIPYVSSTKGIIGHTLGAAGAIEAIITCMSLKKGFIPANTGLEKSDNTICKFTRNSIQKKITYALSNSFAFGGNNTSLVFGRIV